MAEINPYPTDHVQELPDKDQKRKPSGISADNIGEKPADRQKALNALKAVEGRLVAERNRREENLHAVKEVEKFLLKLAHQWRKHSAATISGDDIQKVEKILSELEKRSPGDEPSSPPEPHKPSADISGDDIQNLPKILYELTKDGPEPHQQLRLEEGKLDYILNNFKVGYDNLNYQLRICLLYLSIFPENYVIKKRPIIYWWIANGLVKPITGEKNKTAEEVGEDIFEELLQSHLIMAVDEKETLVVNKCRIHPWIRHMLITFARKAHLFDFDDQGVPGNSNASSGHVCLQNDGDLKRLVEKQSSKGKTANTQEDGVSTKPEEHQESSEGKTANSGNYFKTIFNVGDSYLSLNSTGFTKKLVALHLGRWQAFPLHHIEVERDDLLLKALRTQKLLKYLSLRGISRITELPDSIRELTNLEILDLKACHNLETLPADISALVKLTHLDVSDCFLLDGMPKGLGKLTSLQALKGFIISESKKTPTRIGDLKSLEKLKRFSIHIGSEAEIEKGEFEQLEELKSVQRLKISWGVVSPSKKERVKKEDFKLPTALEKLTLEGLPHEKFPQWLQPSKLKSLKVLTIKGGILDVLDHDESSDHDWKVEILRLWYIKSIKINSPEARHWFPYLRCDPDIKAAQLQKDEKTKKEQTKPQEDEKSKKEEDEQTKPQEDKQT